MVAEVARPDPDAHTGLAVEGHLTPGDPVVVLDDVITTGATVEACARVLKRAGASRVDVLALARAVEATAFVH